MLEDGRILGNYRIDGVLGRGGMGTVYEATQISLRRTVALKVLRADVSADDAFRERFRHEGQIQAKLDHPHIVTVFEAGEFEGHLFIAMRLVRGPTFADLIARALQPERAVRLLGHVADALDAAHDAELIHRDIKPQNILVGPRDHPYLADFGLTKASETPAFTRTGQFVGSIHYSAPEQITGGSVSARTDVYALAAVMFEALTGDVLFRRANEVAVLYAHMSAEPPRISDRRHDLPPALDDVIAAGLAKSPDDRPASAGALLRSAEQAFDPGSHTRSRHRAKAEPKADPEATPRAPDTVQSPDGGARPPITVAPPADALAPITVPSPPRSGEPPSQLAAPAGSATPGRTPPAVAWLAFALVLAVIGLASYAGGRSGSSGRPRDTSPAVASVAGISLDIPAGWTAARAPELAGLKFTNALAIAPTGRTRQGLVAGLVADATGPDLLPDALSRRLGATPPDGVPVDLGSMQALRYRRLRASGSDLAVTLYAAPTARGSFTIACYTPAASEAPETGDDCEAAATTVRLTSPRPYDLAPDRGYATKLRPVLTRLDRERRALRMMLRAARRRATQAARARELAAWVDRAARAMRALVVSARDRDAHDRLVDGLVATREGYERMSAAARDGRRTRFARAADDVRHGEAAVRTALAELRRLGYTT